MINEINPLQIVKVTGDRNRNKFAIVSGKAILARFASVEKAISALYKNRSFYEYWAGSASSSLANTEWKIVSI